MFTALFKCTPIGGVEPGGKKGRNEMNLAFRPRFRTPNWQKDKTIVESRPSYLPGKHRIGQVPDMICCQPHNRNSEEHKVCDDLDPFGEIDVCLELMESGLYEDNRYGMERLVKLVNSELVNSKKRGSIAHALVCGASNYIEADRLRTVFLTYFCETGVSGESRVEEEEEKAEDSSTYSDLEEAAGRHMGELKKPALRVLASTLQLIANLERMKENNIDISSNFWRHVLASMAGMTEVVGARRVEVTLSIKCLRLLLQMEPTTMSPYIRYTILPYVLHAKEFGVSKGDRILARESEKLLNSLGITF
jgi:hypothetical protein